MEPSFTVLSGPPRKAEMEVTGLLLVGVLVSVVLSAFSLMRRLDLNSFFGELLRGMTRQDETRKAEMKKIAADINELEWLLNALTDALAKVSAENHSERLFLRLNMLHRRIAIRNLAEGKIPRGQTMDSPLQKLPDYTKTKLQRALELGYELNFEREEVLNRFAEDPDFTLEFLEGELLKAKEQEKSS
jgi:hypothetical protein